MSDKETPPVDLSVAVKQDGDKSRFDLLPWSALEEISAVLAFGAKKYDDHNWRKGFKWSRLYAACFRHLAAHIRGENKDPETGLSHLAHAACCILFLLEHEQFKLGTDDRYKTPSSKPVYTGVDLADIDDYTVINGVKCCIVEGYPRNKEEVFHRFRSLDESFLRKIFPKQFNTEENK